ncbi:MULTISPECIES: hypothetical protein [unclassified Mesorhizobium]|uniref:hypothetical protein n=1 Tax=unclassified Mesorhizobium TaxID=325217 RepID=UPI003336D500
MREYFKRAYADCADKGCSVKISKSANGLKAPRGTMAALLIARTITLAGIPTIALSGLLYGTHSASAVNAVCVDGNTINLGDDEDCDAFLAEQTSFDISGTDLTVGALETGGVHLNTGVNGLSTFDDNVNMDGIVQIHEAVVNIGAFGGSLKAVSGANVDMDGNQIHNVGTPTAGTDAANKDYVDGVVGAGAAKNVEQDARLDGVEAKNTEQDTTLANHETRITQTEAKDVQQDGRLDGHDTMLASLDTRVTTNTADITALDGRVGALEDSFGDLGRTISQNRTEARQGIAAAIAMTTAPMPSAPGRTSWASNVGYFKGATAFGGSLAHRFDFDEPFAFTAGYAYGGGSSHGFRLGLAGEF